MRKQIQVAAFILVCSNTKWILQLDKEMQTFKVILLTQSWHKFIYSQDYKHRWDRNIKEFHCINKLNWESIHYHYCTDQALFM